MEKILGGWSKVPPNLKCQSDFKKLGIQPTTEADFQVWNSYNWIPLYDINHAIPIPPLTAAEKAARKEARQDKKNRTCSSCRNVVKDKNYIINGLCLSCHEEIELSRWINDTASQALERFQKWSENKQNYLVLDTETTGLDHNAEIVEIAICELNGAVIFESFVKPIRTIPDEVIEIHGITNMMVANAPSWPDVWEQIKPILSEKIVLIYNAAFDERIISQDCSRHDLPIPELKTECIMQNYAEYQKNYHPYHKDFTWISLKNAADDWDIPHHSHRAAGDCTASAELIKNIVEYHKKD